jgi:hypothetical protein
MLVRKAFMRFLKDNGEKALGLAELLACSPPGRESGSSVA